MKRRDFPVARLIPNILTLLSLCAGITAMRLAFEQHWQEAVVAIVFAAIFDVLDGRVARLLNIATKFGAELDSLSDLVSFGVAPAFILFFWSLHEVGSLGWIAVLGFVVCAALRLARFNTMLEDHTAPDWSKSYFTGIPAPAGAGLALMPLYSFIAFGEAAQLNGTIIAMWMLIVGGLMVSRLPTLSLKGRRVSPLMVAPIMVCIALLVALLITKPWITLTICGGLYIACLPLGWYSYRLKEQGKSHV